MRRMLELAYFGSAVLLLFSPLTGRSRDVERRPESKNGEIVARSAIDSYSSLLSRVATDAANALDAGDVTSDHDLQTFIEQRRQAAADAAFETLHQHQQDRIGLKPGADFDPDKAAKLMREYARGWNR